jgi:N-acyl-D-aspartate/D-glutamate deacylase
MKIQRLYFQILVLSIFSTQSCFTLAAENDEVFDIVISNGRVLDPETNLDAIRDIGIIDGSIAEISVESLAAKLVANGELIEANGLVVSPGFIDMHAHGQSQTSANYLIHDGVTTALELEGGVYPVREWLAVRENQRPINFGTSIAQGDARSLAQFAASDRRELEAAYRSSVENLGVFSAQYGELLRDSNYSELSLDQYAVMREELLKGIRDGAIGIGLAHGYTPGATEQEIFDVFEFTAEHNSMIFTHVRESGISAMQEVISNSILTDAALHIVHVNSMALGDIDFVLGMISSARQRGFNISTEVYPYTAASTGLGSALFDEGWKEEMGGIDFNDLQWVGTGERLNAETFRSYRETGGTVIIHMMEEDWIERALSEPFVMVASDGMPFAPGAHPRSAGTFSRVLGRYVRERGVLSLNDAIQKMTIMPAQRLEPVAPVMAKKGRLQESADADITIFDADRILDTATFEEGLSYSVGVEYVLVGGTVVIREGELLEGVFPGKAILGAGLQ